MAKELFKPYKPNKKRHKWKHFANYSKCIRCNLERWPLGNGKKYEYLELTKGNTHNIRHLYAPECISLI